MFGNGALIGMKKVIIKNAQLMILKALKLDQRWFYEADRGISSEIKASLLFGLKSNLN
jgi:hypothetical protein